MRDAGGDRLQAGGRGDCLTPVESELLAYGIELAEEGAAQVGLSFTDIPEADRLINERPEAFLLGVLFTQGIPAERAWAGPYHLCRRLGHLDLERIASDPGAVELAVQMPPMLHRFKRTLPHWIVSAARRIVSEYGGDAARIWAPGSHVLEVTERLLEFDGIGRKKAVMATEILTRHWNVELLGPEAGQVAYDVHVRRVFLRAGLADKDDIASIEQAAARVCPQAPGTLDLAAWLVGREWCRPTRPTCDLCRLGGSCPRRTWLSVTGVGGRRRARD